MDTQTLFQYGVPIALVVGFIVFKRLGQVSRDAAHALVKDGARLIDVRSPAEFSSGHIPGATNIPVGQLGAHVKSLGAKDQPIVVYCASGTRSAVARTVLKGQGFARVYNLGSMSRW